MTWLRLRMSIIRAQVGHLIQGAAMEPPTGRGADSFRWQR